MLRMVDKEYIRKKHYIEGWSIRKISRNFEVSRQTVRKALEDSNIPHYKLSKEKRSPVLEPYKEIIREWLREDQSAPPKQTHTARRIFDRLVAECHFTGGESTVRTFVRKEKNGHVVHSSNCRLGRTGPGRLGKGQSLYWRKANRSRCSASE